MAAVEIITPYLNQIPSEFSGYDIYDDDEESLKRLRKTIYIKDSKNDVLFITNNYGNRYIISLYNFLRPPFRFVVRSSIALSENEDAIIEYGRRKDGSKNNELHFLNFLPEKKYLYIEAHKIISCLKPLIKGNVVIIGPKEGRDKGIYYLNSLSNIPSNVSLVIDTMTIDSYEYILKGEALERFYAFSGVIYYRMMTVDIYNGLERGREPNKLKIIMESIKYKYNPHDIFDAKDVNEMTFHMARLNLVTDQMLKYPFDLLPSAFLDKWIKDVEQTPSNKYAGILITLLLNKSVYILNLLKFTDLTDDTRYNFLSEGVVKDNLFNYFGENKNIAFYLSIFSDIAKNINDIVKWSENNHINYNTVKAIADELETFNLFFIEFDVFDVYVNASNILHDIYGFLKLKKLIDQDVYFDKNNNKYEIDIGNSIIDKSRLPRYIIPFIIEGEEKILFYNAVKADGKTIETHNYVNGKFIFPNTY